MLVSPFQNLKLREFQVKKVSKKEIIEKFTNTTLNLYEKIQKIPIFLIDGMISLYVKILFDTFENPVN